MRGKGGARGKEKKTGNTVEGEYTRTTTGGDSYVMVETGTNSAAIPFTETVTGSENSTITETGNAAAQTYDRDSSGTGSYSESMALDFGGTFTTTYPTGTYMYDLSESAVARSAVFNQTGGDGRYELVNYFNDVSNTSSGNTPGNMNFSPVGEAFSDPGMCVLVAYDECQPTNATSTSAAQGEGLEVATKESGILASLGKGRFPQTAGWLFETNIYVPKGKWIQIVKVTDVTVNFKGKIGISHNNGPVSEPVFALDFELTGKRPIVDKSSPSQNQQFIPQKTDYILWYRAVDKEFAIAKNFVPKGKVNGAKIPENVYDQIKTDFIDKGSDQGKWQYEYLYINLNNAQKIDPNLKTVADVLKLIANDPKQKRIAAILLESKIDFTKVKMAAILYSKDLQFRDPPNDKEPFIYFAK